MLLRLDISLLRAIAIAVIALLGAACSSHTDEPRLPDADAQFSFGLYLSVGDSVSASRSTPADGDTPNQNGYDPGYGYENYIALRSGDFRVYLLDANNKLVHAVPASDINLTPLAGNWLSSKTYELAFKLTADQLEAAGLSPERCVFKLLLLANWRQYPGVAVGASIESIVSAAESLRGFTAQAQPELTADDRIALFGIKQFGPLSLDPDWRTQLGTLHLLRAYSKIEVSNAPTSTTDIKSVVLTRHSTRSWCAPLLPTWQESEYVTNSYKTDYGLSFRDSGTEYETSAPLPLLFNPETGKYTIYVPEFRNIAGSAPRPDSERARLLVTYSDPNQAIDPTYYIEFKYYDDVNAALNGAKKGDFFNISRNCRYSYTLNRGNLGISLKAEVVPYSSVELEPGFGFDDPLPRPPSEWVTPPWVEISPNS